MQDWVKRIVNGDLRALSRAATAIENRRPEGLALLKELSAVAGRARVIGVTGPPGAGKSTLVDQITRMLRDEQRTVGIVTVDPSSPFSGGAILGDRIRMQRHYSDPGVFIRSMATRGSLGGLARSTAEMVTLLDASGKDVVLIETVGVGQDGVAIGRLADITLLVLVPGMGDDIQAIKAGIMEIADIFVVNKADHPGTERVEREIQGLLALASRPDGWTPLIVRTVASEGVGIQELLEAVRKFEEFAGSGRRPSRFPAGFTGQCKIDHLGVAVPSLERALEFWEQQLGMAVSARETVASEKVNVAMLPANGPRIELLEPAGPGSVIGRFIERCGGGIHHVALSVPDLHAVVIRLRASGVRVLNEPRPGAGGRLYVFVHPASTGGVLLELIQQQEEPES